VNVRSRPIALLACIAALGVAGCGGSKKADGPGVPQATVTEIDKQLDSLTNRVDARIPGACSDAQDQNIPAIADQVSGLPENTDPQVRSALSKSVDKLSSLLDSECTSIDKEDQQRKDNTDTATTPTETTPTETTPTETTPTETTPTETTPTTPSKTPTSPSGGTSPPGGDGSGGSESPQP
jgi:hypothetical protein